MRGAPPGCPGPLPVLAAWWGKAESRWQGQHVRLCSRRVSLSALSSSSAFQPFSPLHSFSCCFFTPLHSRCSSFSPALVFPFLSHPVSLTHSPGHSPLRPATVVAVSSSAPPPAGSEREAYRSPQCQAQKGSERSSSPRPPSIPVGWSRKRGWKPTPLTHAALTAARGLGWLRWPCLEAEGWMTGSREGPATARKLGAHLNHHQLRFMGHPWVLGAV